MVAVVIGWKNVNFTGKDGNAVNGKSVYIVEPISEKRGEGQAFILSNGKQSSIFFTDADFDALGLYVGCSCEFSFNRYGSIDRETFTII